MFLTTAQTTDHEGYCQSAVCYTFFGSYYGGTATIALVSYKVHGSIVGASFAIVGTVESIDAWIYG
jgi:hypothetical protein